MINCQPVCLAFRFFNLKFAMFNLQFEMMFLRGKFPPRPPNLLLPWVATHRPGRRAASPHRLAIGGVATDAVFLHVNRPLASPSCATPSLRGETYGACEEYGGYRSSIK